MVEEFFYHPNKKSAFIKKSREALATLQDVLLMAPLFEQESLLISKHCNQHHIKVAFFNTYIDPLDQEIFIGQDLFQSGKIAAGLISKTFDSTVKVAVVHIDREPHIQLKDKGFKAFFKDKQQGHLLLGTKNFKTNTCYGFENEISEYLKQNPFISGIFVTNSKAYKLIPILSEHNYKAMLVGYDLLKENIAYLKKGKIDYLIHQKPKHQAYLGVVYFAEFFVFGKKILNKNFCP